VKSGLWKVSPFQGLYWDINLMRNYTMNGMTHGVSVEQRDLGVFVHRSLKAEGDVSSGVEKADGTLAFINGGTDYTKQHVAVV